MNIETAIKVQNKLRGDIVRFYKKCDYYKFLKLIDTYAIFTTYFNNVMTDDVIEDLLQDFAQKEIGIYHIGSHKNTIILYDQIGTTVCLGIQYLRGLVASGFEVLYVFDSIYVEIQDDLLNEIKRLGIKYWIFDQTYQTNDPVSRIKNIRDLIIDTEASKMVVHSPANNSYSSSVLYSLTGIKRYRIVPGDHHFYTGVRCIDYFYEFREYGIGIANIFRKISLSKIIKLPFYPLDNCQHRFLGFPKESENKTIILSAGAECKYFGSDLYFDVSCYILNKHPETVILHIGEYSFKFYDFVRRNKLEKRYILLGYRNDFNSCVNKCDILLSSYPEPGGLVSQIAAHYKKPIIGMKENEDLSIINNIEDVLGIDEDLGITHSSNSDLYLYIDRLIEDKEFRVKMGESVFNKMFTEKEFNERLKKSLLTPKELVYEAYDKEGVMANKDTFANYCARLQNERRPACIASLYNFYGLLFFIKFPYLLGPFIKLMLMHSKDRYLKNNKMVHS